MDGEDIAFDDDETIPNPDRDLDGTTCSDNGDLVLHEDAVDRLMVSYCNHSSRNLLTSLTRTTQMLTPKLGLRHLSLKINNTWDRACSYRQRSSHRHLINHFNSSGYARKISDTGDQFGKLDQTSRSNNIYI